MSIQFSATGTGIVQRARKMCRVDSSQWPTVNVANSVNDWLDFLTGFMIAKDKTFKWDDTNHTKLPQGRTDLTVSVSDYSFLTDEQGNNIITLTGVSLLQSNGTYKALTLVDKTDPKYNEETFGVESGTPTEYDKIADNIIRLNKVPPATLANGLKFYFQRTPSYFTDSDTTKTPGVSPILHRGFVISSAYDCAMTLGLDNLDSLSRELEIEKQKAITYFSGRNEDKSTRMVANKESSR